ncbi:MAG: hypothetical protein RJA70_657 [Pseudomonadota bacterium]|jgi:CBS domain-containing protein
MLNKSVSFLMTADELVTVTVKDSLGTVRQLLSERPIHHIPVLDGAKLVGIISSTDLLRLGVGLEYQGDTTPDTRLDESFPVVQVMETSLVTLGPKDTLRRAAQLLLEESFHSLPVVDGEGELVGILTTRDLLRYMIEQDAESGL